MSWESPINVIIGEAEAKVEGDVFKVIQHYGIDVDKGELLKALSYDRGQYDRGWSDGYAQAKEDGVRCQDCYYYENSQCMRVELVDDGEHWDSRLWQPDDFCSYAVPREVTIENDGTYEVGE